MITCMAEQVLRRVTFESQESLVVRLADVCEQKISCGLFDIAIAGSCRYMLRTLYLLSERPLTQKSDQMNSFMLFHM